MSDAFRVNILTIFPEMFESFFASSILGRAREQGLIDVRVTDIRPYSSCKHHNTDDYPFGGGAGIMFGPFEFHLAVDYKWGLSSYFHTYYYSDEYWFFAYPRIFMFSGTLYYKF